MNNTTPEFSEYARERLDYHIAHPEVSPEAYRESKRRLLSKDVTSRHRIYLDTKYWIVFRDASLGKASSSLDLDLLNLVKSLKASEKVICPLSYSSVHELWLQKDLASRRATAALMDELSDSVCLQPPHILFDMELWHLLFSALVTANPEPFSRGLVWTKVGYYLGEPTFMCKSLPDEIAQVIQKCVDDSLFESTLGEMIDALSKGPPPPMADRDRLAIELTTGKYQHSESSFSELYRQEIAGGLEAHHDSCCNVMEDLCKATGLITTVDSTDRDAGGRMVRGLIESALKAGKIQARFPQLHINASLHAASRWDNRRTYKRGDCEDFRHAGSALPYCNYFLTERSLAHLLCNKPLELDVEYETKVRSDSQSAIRELSRLL
jgi:hypothetical protein